MTLDSSEYARETDSTGSGCPVMIDGMSSPEASRI